MRSHTLTYGESVEMYAQIESKGQNFVKNSIQNIFEVTICVIEKGSNQDITLILTFYHRASQLNNIYTGVNLSFRNSIRQYELSGRS